MNLVRYPTGLLGAFAGCLGGALTFIMMALLVTDFALLPVWFRWLVAAAALTAVVRSAGEYRHVTRAVWLGSLCGLACGAIVYFIFR